MNNYETVLIVTPVLSDAQVQEVADKFQGVITENGGQIGNREDWGRKKLAYPIQKKTTGFYFLIEFAAEGDIINKLETQYRRDERVIRFLTFKQDKFAVEYSAKRRAKLANKQEEETMAQENNAAQSEIRYLNPVSVDVKKKKYCRFKKLGIKYVDYKDGEFLKKFLNEQGKILPRRLTGTSQKFQKKVAQAVKRARHLAILPFVTDGMK